LPNHVTTAKPRHYPAPSHAIDKAIKTGPDNGVVVAALILPQLKRKKLQSSNRATLFDASLCPPCVPSRYKKEGNLKPHEHRALERKETSPTPAHAGNLATVLLPCSLSPSSSALLSFPCVCHPARAPQGRDLGHCALGSTRRQPR
jgi:hypothetical protein